MKFVFRETKKIEQFAILTVSHFTTVMEKVWFFFYYYFIF